MGFISLSFLAFLGVAVLIYYLLPSKNPMGMAADCQPSVLSDL